MLRQPLLSGLLVLGQVGPALAAQDDSNYGPAFPQKSDKPPGSLDGPSGDGRGSGPQAVAPANAAPAEQADGAQQPKRAASGTAAGGAHLPDQNAAQGSKTIPALQADAEATRRAQLAEEAARQAAANTCQIQVLRPDYHAMD